VRVTWFLVESYAPPGTDVPDVEARIGDAVRANDGNSITHLASILLPEDETWFHIFDAADRELVVAVSDAADLSPLRIVETTHSAHWR
jgi:hypothetical protein